MFIHCSNLSVILGRGNVLSLLGHTQKWEAVSFEPQFGQARSNKVEPEEQPTWTCVAQQSVHCLEGHILYISGLFLRHLSRLFQSTSLNYSVFQLPFSFHGSKNAQHFLTQIKANFFSKVCCCFCFCSINKECSLSLIGEELPSCMFGFEPEPGFFLLLKTWQGKHTHSWVVIGESVGARVAFGPCDHLRVHISALTWSIVLPS